MLLFERTPARSALRAARDRNGFSMTEGRLHHVSDHDLNRYSLVMITGQELALIKEHLRWCLDCLDCLDRVEENSHSVREKERAHLMAGLQTSPLEQRKF